MLLDCKKEATPRLIETDVAIVGSGPAGLSLAMALGARGISVVVLEAGGASFDKVGQEFFRAGSIEPTNHGPIHLYRRRSFGGTTAIWGGRCIPLDPIDFEDRDWIPDSRWPIPHDEVHRYYPEALKLCRAGNPTFDALGAGLPGPPKLADGVNSADVVLDRIERFSEPTNFGLAYRDQLSASSSTTVLLNATAIEISTDTSGSKCHGVRVLTATREVVEVRAKRTVIAAGGLETARLLLCSQKARPAGLGNDRDLVGRFYQAHLEGEVGKIVLTAPPQQFRLDYQISPEGIYCRRYIWLSPEAQRREHLAQLIARPTHPNIVDPNHRHPVLSAMYLVKGLIISEYSRRLTSTEHQKLNAASTRGAAFLFAHAMNVLRAPRVLASFGINWARKRTFATRKLPSVFLRDPTDSYPLDISAEQAPNFHSRVTLSGERDSNGMPRLAVNWRTLPIDHQRVARGMQIIRDAFATSKTARIDLAGLEGQVAQLSRVGGHHIGTARMSVGSASGVTNANCEVFGTRGLYVAGAALFPSSGFANPTLTIVALALRLADHLAAERP